jgi:hypothetical protein
MATTAAAMTAGEAEGFALVIESPFLYQYHCSERGDREVAEEAPQQNSLDVRFVFA